MPNPTNRFLQELAHRVLVFDGGMGTQIYSRNLSVEHDYCGCENCTDILVKTRPDVIQEIHESFLAVGADAVEDRVVAAEAEARAAVGHRRAAGRQYRASGHAAVGHRARDGDLQPA